MNSTPPLRPFFPVAEHWIYLNHAAVSPLATPTRQAMQRHLAELERDGAQGWRTWQPELERVRGLTASLLGAAPSEMALLKNTSEGLAAVAQGLDWRPGDRMIGFQCEFPANLYPWLALQRRGVRVELLPEAALLDLKQVRRACRGARLLAVSFVQYLSGLRADCAALGDICRETGTLLVVDGIQGLGAFPLNVKHSGIHACAAAGAKWLAGPEGARFLFVDEAILDQIIPTEVGWLSLSGWEDFVASSAAVVPDPLVWRSGSARFECGSVNMLGCIGLGAAIELLMSVGIEAIARHILGLGEHLAHGLRRQGWQILYWSEFIERRSGITSFRSPSETAEATVARLEAAGILCSCRQGWVRCSPHGYNTTDEIDRLLEVLGSAA